MAEIFLPFEFGKLKSRRQSSSSDKSSSHHNQKACTQTNYGTTVSVTRSESATSGAPTRDSGAAGVVNHQATAPGDKNEKKEEKNNVRKAVKNSIKGEEDSDYEKVKPWEPGPGDRPMYDGPDMPSTDLPEDHFGPEPQQVPLDVTRLPKIKGYEHVGYHSNSATAPAIPPPAFDHIPHIDKHKQPEEQYSSVSHINETQARESLLHYAAERCCYGKSAARDMLIHKITPSSALHYTLETYTETRSTTWEQESYKGQVVDGPSNGCPPPPWDIHCNPTQMFHDEVHSLEVPHTASVIACHGCASLGWVRCHGCMGRGFKRCMYCHGTGRIWKTDAHGHRHTESCWHCHGTGRKRCQACGGDGRVVCRTCGGFRQLKCFIKLVVTYTNHDIERIVEHTDMPDHLVKNASGEMVFEQTQPRVWAIAHYPDLEMCRSSQRMVTEQQNGYPDSRIIMQRQRLRAVPVSECAYNYRDDERRFWVYGKENAIYAPDYPQKCCWGCVIM